ncbi:uncharacterized protein BDR25DRAFT_104134 [Lindgomyces ingoldianus]|uniref:Uncharacterized protein n=1 Tax=Lindgomyces ingoldianus TaxID=673940 RepID=A0ACB6QBX5_9PLEO|nr:uncharacterized protein BDR25DRAFT_104134 [Lindgomyces ingoldianus]KAF2464005.1 hypothetical protein BDR25DRAFT_104134 [Lindgomyces ingoldianus]
MGPKPRFNDPLEASSYFHPIGTNPYQHLRKRLVEQIIAQGYDYDTLTEIPVDWSNDQDTNGHISNPVYGRYASTGNVRLFESFASTIGDISREMLSGKEIGPLLKGYHYDLKRPASYPDAVIVGNRLSKLLADRYFTTTTIWSLRQQCVVAELRGWIVFVDPATGRPVDLVEKGEPYATLWKHIEEKVERANTLLGKWNTEHRPREKL